MHSLELLVGPFLEFHLGVVGMVVPPNWSIGKTWVDTCHSNQSEECLPTLKPSVFSSDFHSGAPGVLFCQCSPVGYFSTVLGYLHFL